MKHIEAQPKYIALDAETMAGELGSVKAANMVVLGAASPFLDLDYERLEEAIRFVFGRKGEDLVQLNLNALKAGREYAEKRMN
jgi:indolepyruvate ferredoxin oxidoreductase, beta subunit